MLFSERLKRDREAELIADGVSLWTEDIAPEARQKLLYEVEDLAVSTGTDDLQALLYQAAEVFVCRRLGLPSLVNRSGYPPRDNVRTVISASPTDLVFSTLEGLIEVSTRLLDDPRPSYYFSKDKFEPALAKFKDRTKDILREFWLAFDLVGKEFVPVSSRELHESAVVPALTLLGGDSRFQLAEKSYQEALEEIHEGNPADAITDAATCLQEMLKSIGAKGNTVSKCMDWAVNHGHLSPYDDKIGKWIEAYRSDKGDAHNASPASVEDAWLIVHVVGALVVRLAQSTELGDEAADAP